MLNECAGRRRRAAVSGTCCLALLSIAPLGRAASQATVTTPVTVVSGFVRDSSGNPLQGAQVFAGQTLAATTGANGAFRIPGFTHGLLTLAVRHMGFRPSLTQWELDSDSLSLDLRLSRMPAELPAVKVMARAQPYDGRLAGFNQRRQHSVGYFITRDQIEKRSDHVITDALREVPGVRLRTVTGGGRVAYMSGSRCAALVFVDGFPATNGGFDLNGIDLEAVEGIEVYPNASTMPSEFIAPGGGEQCGVVAIWLSPMRPRVRSDAVRQEDQADVAKLIASHEVYAPDSVDEQATLVENTARVSYPDSLLRAGVGARLVATFVVDSVGEVEIRTLEVKGTPTPPAAFVRAVREALRGARFKPARIGAAAVRQLVVLPFVFDPHAPRVSQASTP